MRLSLPVMVWLMGFSAVYALQGLSCSRHWPAEVAARPVLIATWIIAVGVQALILIAMLYAPSPSRFIQTTAIALAVTALVAAIWTLMPVLAVSVCR